MLTENALKHFTTRGTIASVLGISKVAVHKWGMVVPYVSALRLSKLTQGALKIDESLYDERRRPRPSQPPDSTASAA